MGHGKMTLWRVELEKMERYFKDHKLPEVLTHLSVDEVYARSNHNENETRNDQFFTVVGSHIERSDKKLRFKATCRHVWASLAVQKPLKTG
jgi:hypothetical protein